MNEEQLKLLSRLMKTDDGRAFVDEILAPMFLQNHKDILNVSTDMRAETIGFGHCLQLLVGLFEDCDRRLSQQAKTDTPEWGA